MIRAALALYEATGERGYLDRALAWQRRSTATTPTRTTAAISSPPTTPRAWWCARTATTDDATPNPNAMAAQNLVRLAALTGDDAWREQADRLFDGVLAAPATTCSAMSRCSTRSTCGCAAPRSWSPGAGRGVRAAAAGSCRSLDRIVLRAPDRRRLPATHPAQAKIARRRAARRSSASAKRARCR